MNDNDIVNLLNDKSALLKYILNMITSSEKFSENLPLMRDKGWSEQGMLDKVIEVTSIQSQQIKHLGLIALVLAQSDDFDVMIGHMLNKMGRGEEALRAMINAKLKRKY